MRPGKKKRFTASAPVEIQMSPLSEMLEPFTDSLSVAELSASDSAIFPSGRAFSPLDLDGWIEEGAHSKQQKLSQSYLSHYQSMTHANPCYLDFTVEDLERITPALFNRDSLPARVSASENKEEVISSGFFKVAEEKMDSIDLSEASNLCVQCVDAEEALQEALNAMPKEQKIKKRIASKVLEVVKKTAKTCSMEYLPDLIKALKQTTALLREDLCDRVVDGAKKAVVVLKAKSKINIMPYLKLVSAQPKKLVGALMMLAGITLVAAAGRLGFFTAGSSLLILATAIPSALILSGATLWKNADIETTSMQNLVAKKPVELFINPQPAMPIEVDLFAAVVDKRSSARASLGHMRK